MYAFITNLMDNLDFPHAKLTYNLSWTLYWNFWFLSHLPNSPLWTLYWITDFSLTCYTLPNEHCTECLVSHSHAKLTLMNTVLNVWFLSHMLHPPSWTLYWMSGFSLTCYTHPHKHCTECLLSLSHATSTLMNIGFSLTSYTHPHEHCTERLLSLSHATPILMNTVLNVWFLSCLQHSPSWTEISGYILTVIKKASTKFWNNFFFI